MSALIRPAVPADGARCAQIHMDAWVYAYSDCVPVEIIERTNRRRPSQWRTIIPTENNRSHYVIDDEAHETVGFFVIQPSRDEGADDKTLELVSLYLDPSRVRKGFGSAAVRWIAGEAHRRGDRQVTLWVLDENTRAKVFYLKCGFVPDGSRKPSGLGDTSEIRMRMDV